MLRYAITSRAQYAGSEPERHAALVGQAERLAAEGVEYIQLREKDLPVQDLIGVARKILNAIRSAGAGTRLLINSRPDVALVAGAHGVHLPSGEDQLAPRQVRWLFARARAATPVVSVSCHTLAEVVRARETGADLVLFAPVFGKSAGTSMGGELVLPGTGLEALREACAAAGETPVLALGGVTAENRATTIAAGAAGIAAIRLFR